MPGLKRIEAGSTRLQRRSERMRFTRSDSSAKSAKRPSRARMHLTHTFRVRYMLMQRLASRSLRHLPDAIRIKAARDANKAAGKFRCGLCKKNVSLQSGLDRHHTSTGHKKNVTKAAAGAMASNLSTMPFGVSGLSGVRHFIFSRHSPHLATEQLIPPCRNYHRRISERYGLQCGHDGRLFFSLG